MVCCTSVRSVQFPYAWPELFPVAESLMSASASSAEALVTFLQRLPFYAEDLAGETLELRYGFWVGDALPSAEGMEALYEEYVGQD